MNTQERPLVLINHLVEPPGRITGITRYAFGLLGGLLRHGGVRILLVTTWDRHQLPPDIAQGAGTIVTLPHIASTPLNNLRQRHALRKIARQYRPDAVYAMNPMCPPVRGIPSVITLHDLYYEVLGGHYAWRHRLWWKLFFGDASRQAALIACVSANTAADAARMHPNLAGKTCVIAGAGVLPIGNSPLPAGLASGPYVLLLGNITPNKNVGFLITALRLLSARGQPLKAVHVGRDLTGDLTNALAGDNGILLQTLGGLNDGELDAILRHATALVQPSLYEGFGLPIIEAHERGIPVIASDIAIFREVTGGGGLLVPPGNAEALADALHRITNDPALRAELADKARQNSARYTWEKSAAAAAGLIAGLCASDKRQ